jgi:signal transduction histidine kinase
MNLQAKLTLGYVLLVVLMVSLISVVDLGNSVQQEFKHTLRRADILNPVATDWVKYTLNSPEKRTVPLREALRDESLTNRLVSLLSEERIILEIAVVDSKTSDILADTLPELVGTKAQNYVDFGKVVQDASIWQKLKILYATEPEYYQRQRPLATPSGELLLYVRVIIHPGFIKEEVRPALARNAEVAVISIIGAFGITLLFSTVAFRPLGQLRHQLDLVTRGDYDLQRDAPAKATDELSVMASKVNLLGQRLRGAQFEVSDLRGNIDRLLEGLEDAVLIFNRDRNLVFASGAVERYLGRDRSTLSGLPIEEIFPPSSTLGLLIAQASQTGRSIRARRVPFTNGTEPALVPVVLLSVDSLDALPGAAGPGSGLLVRLRDPEAERQIGRQLQTADRLAAISRVSGGVAHEVKNPLNAILLHIEVAKSKLSRGATDIQPQMDIISSEILRLDRVVKTFLDFTRPVELKLSTVQIQDVLNEIVDLARPQAAATNISVDMVQEAEGVEVRIDRDLFKQAMLNVVVNAIEAMPEGGQLRFHALATEDSAEIRISDTGVGIPDELREKIFRLYFTTRKEGSGIGLAMTFRIVQLHDGTIDFTSEPGKGTTFFIRLPIAV